MGECEAGRGPWEQMAVGGSLGGADGRWQRMAADGRHQGTMVEDKAEGGYGVADLLAKSQPPQTTSPRTAFHTGLSPTATAISSHHRYKIGLPGHKAPLPTGSIERTIQALCASMSWVPGAHAFVCEEVGGSGIARHVCKISAMCKKPSERKSSTGGMGPLT